MLGQWGKAKQVLDCGEKGGLKIQIGGGASLRVFFPSSLTSVANCTWRPSPR